MPAGTEELVLAIGGCSGRDVDKEATLGLPTCLPGWRQPGSSDAAAAPASLGKESKSSLKKHKRARVDCEQRAISSGVAHLVCTMDQRTPHDDHWIMTCRIEHAYVRAGYWNGNGLVASPSQAPLLKFVGSKKFAYMSAEPHPCSHAPGQLPHSDDSPPEGVPAAEVGASCPPSQAAPTDPGHTLVDGIDEDGAAMPRTG